MTGVLVVGVLLCVIVCTTGMVLAAIVAGHEREDGD